MSKTKVQLEDKTKEKKTCFNDYAEGEYDSTPYGTRYRVLGNNHIRVYEEFIIDKERLLLFEEFLYVNRNYFSRFIVDAIWEKMDNEIRNANVEELGKRVKERFMKQWDLKREYENQYGNLQQPINNSGGY